MQRSLDLRAGTGAAKKLSLLQGEPCNVDQLPEGLDKGVSQDVAEAYEWGLLDEDQHPEIDAEEAVQIEAVEALCDAEGELEVWGADTEDEDLFPVSSTTAKVKDFMHRDAFKALEELGLALIPNHLRGVFLSYHKSTQCWQGFFPGIRAGLGFCWGGSTGRALAAQTLSRFCRAFYF